MIALLLGLASSVALAGPCDREVVLSRGLVVESGHAVSVMADLDVDLYLRKRHVDGIPGWYVRKARARWKWSITADEPMSGEAFVGGGEALCEGPNLIERVQMGASQPMTLQGRWDRKLTAIDACRVRVVLRGTIPSVPNVELDVHGPPPPGPEAPVDGPLTVTPGQDLVIDIPGCL